MIIRGKDKGETGTIKRVIRSQNRVIVEGKNLVRDEHNTPHHNLGIPSPIFEVSVFSIPLPVFLVLITLLIV